MISETVARLYPDKKCNIEAIYLFIKNDLHDKGKSVAVNISDPSSEKGITFSEVRKIIKNNTDIEDKNYLLASEMINDSTFDLIKKANIRRELERYKMRNLFPGTIQSDLKINILNSNLIQNINNDKNDEFYDLINDFQMKLSKEYDNTYNINLVMAGVFYELSKHIRKTT